MPGCPTVHALLSLLAAGASAAQTPADTMRQPRVLRLVLVEADTSLSFPGPGWPEASQISPGRRYGLKVEFSGPPQDTWQLLRSLEIALVSVSARGQPETRRFPAPFLRAATCAQEPCSSGGVFVAYGDLGFLPYADTVRVAVRQDNTTLVERVVVSQAAERFRMGASLGGTLPLNGDTGQGLTRRVGLNGRLHVSQVRGVLIRESRLLAAILLPVRWLAPDARFAGGTFLMEGDFVLGVGVLDTSVTTPPALAYRPASEGQVRIEVPLLDLGDPLFLRAFAQGGFVVFEGEPGYWEQRFFGMRLGIDAVDLTGRQSFIEIAWGKSTNIQPTRRRRRVVVQLRVPTTEFVFQIMANQGLSDRGASPVVLSFFTPLDLRQIRDIILGQPSGGESQ